MKLPTLLEDLETQKPQKWDEKVSATDLEMVMAGVNQGSPSGAKKRLSGGPTLP